MKAQDGKFTIFFNVLEFANWLDSSVFSRIIHLLQCHHTYLPSYKHFQNTNHFELLRAMENAHLERGFSQIAQNLTTFPDGSIALCRPIDTIPAGIKGANKYGICIENLGNFDANQDVMSPAHQECIVDLYALLCKRFNLEPNSDTIVAHHWFDLITGERTNGTGNTKSCPGTNFFGGNTVPDFEANFIPLVTQRLTAYAGAVPAEAPQALYTAAVAVDVLNVRALPSTDAAVIKQLARGVEVSVYASQEPWCKIDALQSLWVNGRYLSRTAMPVNTQARYAAQVTADLLNVRTSPSLSGEVAEQLSRGASVYVYDERDGWARINSSESLWVSSRYLGRAQAATAP